MLAGMGCPVPEPGPVRQKGLRGASQGQQPLQKALCTCGAASGEQGDRRARKHGKESGQGRTVGGREGGVHTDP